MKKIIKYAIFLIPVIAFGISSCKKCNTCNYTNSKGNKGPSFEVCGDDIESLKSQKDASSYVCIESTS